MLSQRQSPSHAIASAAVVLTTSSLSEPSSTISTMEAAADVVAGDGATLIEPDDERVPENLLGLSLGDSPKATRAYPCSFAQERPKTQARSQAKKPFFADASATALSETSAAARTPPRSATTASASVSASVHAALREIPPALLTRKRPHLPTIEKAVELVTRTAEAEAPAAAKHLAQKVNVSEAALASAASEPSTRAMSIISLEAAATSTASSSAVIESHKAIQVPWPAWRLRLLDSNTAVNCDPRVHAHRRAHEASMDWSPYMHRQADINEAMWAILVDWLHEVWFKFKLLPETYFLTVSLADRYLRKKPVIRQKLQLVGVVAMHLASKYEEIFAPEARDFVHITDKAYSRDQILEMEDWMLDILDFRLCVPTHWHFITEYANGVLEERSDAIDIKNERHEAAAAAIVGRIVAAAAGSSTTASNLPLQKEFPARIPRLLADYLLHMSMPYCSVLAGVPPSLLAAACVFVAWMSFEWPGKIMSWDDIVREQRCDYESDELRAFVRTKLKPVYDLVPKSSLQAAHKYYELPKCCCVSKLTLKWPVD